MRPVSSRRCIASAAEMRLCVWLDAGKGPHSTQRSCPRLRTLPVSRASGKAWSRSRVWDTVLGLEPDSPHRFLREAQLEDVALAFADFADLKSPYSAGHSRRVGELAERITLRLRLPIQYVTTIRRASLMHDVGLAAVPSYTLARPREKLTQAEREQLRLHPYHAERILARVPALESAAPLVAAHHERMDGKGYYRGLAGEHIPVGARIIAVADTFDELAHDSPEQGALAPELALERLRDQTHWSLWTDAVDA